jgi:hypothetical protein
MKNIAKGSTKKVALFSTLPCSAIALYRIFTLFELMNSLKALLVKTLPWSEMKCLGFPQFKNAISSASITIPAFGPSSGVTATILWEK